MMNIAAPNKSSKTQASSSRQFASHSPAKTLPQESKFAGRCQTLPACMCGECRYGASVDGVNHWLPWQSTARHIQRKNHA